MSSSVWHSKHIVVIDEVGMIYLSIYLNRAANRTVTYTETKNTAKYPLLVLVEFFRHSKIKCKAKHDYTLV